MIDKDRAEANALLKGERDPQVPHEVLVTHCTALLRLVFGGTFCVCLCQFHVVQAIMRWTSDDEKVSGQPMLTAGEIKSVLKAFHKLQMDDEEWTSVVDIFKREIQDIANNLEKPHLAQRIIKYFEKNWLHGFWRHKRSDTYNSVDRPASGHKYLRLCQDRYVG